MKTGKSLQDLAAELERQVEARKDYIAPQGQVRAELTDATWDKSPEIVLAGINSGQKAIRPFAHKQLADVLGIPQRYYDRMQVEQPDLLARNINTWLHAQPKEKRMIRTIDDEVRAVLSPRFRPLDNFELAQAVLPKLIETQAQIMSCELTETRMYIKAILPTLSDELPAGMTWGREHNAIAEYRGNQAGKVVAAIVISNSEVGNGSLRVEPSVFTTWCTNLAVMKSASMRKYHVGRAHGETENWEVFRDETRQADDHAFFLKVADVTAAAFNPEIFQAAVQQIREAAADKIESDDLPAVVEMTVKKLALPGSTGKSILNFLAQGGDFSRWGLSSAVTATANNFGDYEGATELERAGGELLAMPASDWRLIAKAAA